MPFYLQFIGLGGRTAGACEGPALAEHRSWQLFNQLKRREAARSCEIVV